MGQLKSFFCTEHRLDSAILHMQAKTISPKYIESLDPF